MATNIDQELEHRFLAAHPWHGVNPRLTAGALSVYIENVPFDVMKYEVDQASGLLRIDQPFQTAVLPPSAYGFVPMTLCGNRVAKLALRQQSDQAPMDIFVLSERPISVPGVIAKVRLLGGLMTLDQNQADAKLIAVLDKDPGLGGVRSIAELPIHLLDRITHFLAQTALDTAVEVGEVFGEERALRFLQAAMDDYHDAFPS